jgi:hypothetical protein
MQGSYAALARAWARRISGLSKQTERDTEMTISKLSALALTAVVALGAAAPALASDTSKNFDDAYYIQQLRYEGVNAIAADNVTGDTFRATVVAADGHQYFAFFDKDSLLQIKH